MTVTAAVPVGEYTVPPNLTVSFKYIKPPAQRSGTATEPEKAAAVAGEKDATGKVLPVMVHGPAASGISSVLVGSLAVSEQRMGITTRALSKVYTAPTVPPVRRTPALTNPLATGASVVVVGRILSAM